MNQVQPGFYQHFKGGIYEVLEMRDAETQELLEGVYYRCTKTDKGWFRTVENFTEHVDKPEYNYSGPRFKRL